MFPQTSHGRHICYRLRCFLHYIYICLWSKSISVPHFTCLAPVVEKISPSNPQQKKVLTWQTSCFLQYTEISPKQMPFILFSICYCTSILNSKLSSAAMASAAQIRLASKLLSLITGHSKYGTGASSKVITFLSSFAKLVKLFWKLKENTHIHTHTHTYSLLISQTCSSFLKRTKIWRWFHCLQGMSVFQRFYFSILLLWNAGTHPSDCKGYIRRSETFAVGENWFYTWGLHLLRCHAAQVGRWLPTIREKLSTPSSILPRNVCYQLPTYAA